MNSLVNYHVECGHIQFTCLRYAENDSSLNLWVKGSPAFAKNQSLTQNKSFNGRNSKVAWDNAGTEAIVPVARIKIVSNLSYQNGALVIRLVQRIWPSSTKHLTKMV